MSTDENEDTEIDSFHLADGVYVEAKASEYYQLVRLTLLA